MTVLGIALIIIGLALVSGLEWTAGPPMPAAFLFATAIATDF
jgi:hypothetical protein